MLSQFCESFVLWFYIHVWLISRLKVAQQRNKHLDLYLQQHSHSGYTGINHIKFDLFCKSFTIKHICLSWWLVNLLVCRFLCDKKSLCKMSSLILTFNNINKNIGSKRTRKKPEYLSTFLKRSLLSYTLSFYPALV